MGRHRILSTHPGSEERLEPKAGQPLAAPAPVPDSLQEQLGALLRENARLRNEVHRLERAAGRMRHLALHDALTGLPNRALMLDRLRVAIAHAERDDQRVALLLLDLDRFKEINDGFGHAAGDQLLRMVAGRLDAATRSGDTVARLGGDEFVVVLPRIDKDEAETRVVAVIEKLRRALRIACVLDEGRVTVSASLGVALWPDNGNTPDELLEYADASMYRDKARRSLPTDWPGGGAVRKLILRRGDGLPSADSMPSDDGES